MSVHPPPWRAYLDGLLKRAPVLPVLVISDADAAVPLARALVAGGVTVLEVTLRTPAALESIRRIHEQVPEAVVGAGTVVTPAQVLEARVAGAQFLVSPGATAELLDAMFAWEVPFLPGAVTPSEVMSLLERGLTHLKFFPAEASGGVAMLKALAGPLPQALFCPTGGIDRAKAPAYLGLPNVLCVGGSWIAPDALVTSGNWSEITHLAREAVALRG